ncbi:hypothetical protein D0Z07_3741 [Hyphodiscus hymeniophilus]|uniref:Uncharacterized protein n=1 Tax=Hyphodiscus hymeniophilus TaxID=353542 RepID=A0A9P6VKB9_9HELO|nr:hypothetical protein D0Z07_3741 [Hyphodiscus hymeniophilus]
MMFTRGFSLTNFAIGTSALCFQVFVLYPWHEKLDEDFEALKKEHLRVLHSGEIERKNELQTIKKCLERIEESERSKGKGWWS